MAEFYRQYKGRKLSPPAALRAAKKYLRRVTIQELAEKNWFDIALKNGELSSEAREAVLVLSNMPPKSPLSITRFTGQGSPASGATEGGIEMEQREQNDNKHLERKQHINAVIKLSDAMRETERDIRSAYVGIHGER